MNTYIFGLICSDGCLSYDKHSHRNNINITLKDFDIMSKLNKILTPDKKLYVSHRGSGAYSIQYKNEEAINFLMKNGLTYRKSLTLRLPNIPDELFWDFIRGFFDGDGCIYSSYTVNKEYRFISITSGSKEFLEDIQKRLMLYNISARINKDSRKNTYYLKIYKQSDVRLFGQYMYKNADLYLERKKEKFNFFL